MNLNMSVLDMAFIGLLALAILLLLFAVLSVILGINTGNRLKKLQRRRPKAKKKRKGWKRACAALKKKRNSSFKNSVLLIVLALLFGASGFYARYYQLTNMSTANTTALSKGYYLLDETEQQFESLKNGASPEKTLNNFRELSSQLVSVGMETAYGGMSSDYQKLLNRYFDQVRKLGINLGAQNLESLQNTGNIDSYVEDITKIKERQKKIIDEFEVNESALQQKK
ncbi:hypothetical protein [Candidatus Enterococcus clewellii]|uniref:Uncharacterized protein n=1 Tax=Candidatus Enterococcus clewellii TaxID=1834193 RepID=A0A242K5H7_9ENTE|nr:hypothetical protein [Enterococcus sp. 9E7_DIV0242]OTP14582.1 hypothetical protein A5888_002683 [Enterococcus sp. 9E7_DIV0242]